MALGVLSLIAPTRIRAARAMNMRVISACLTGLAVLTLFLAGFFKVYPVEMFYGGERTVVLDPAVHRISHRAGLSHYLDISKLHLEARADNAYARPELHV